MHIGVNSSLVPFPTSGTVERGSQWHCDGLLRCLVYEKEKAVPKRAAMVLTTPKGLANNATCSGNLISMRRIVILKPDWKGKGKEDELMGLQKQCWSEVKTLRTEISGDSFSRSWII